MREMLETHPGHAAPHTFDGTSLPPSSSDCGPLQRGADARRRLPAVRRRPRRWWCRRIGGARTAEGVAAASPPSAPAPPAGGDGDSGDAGAGACEGRWRRRHRSHRRRRRRPRSLGARPRKLDGRPARLGKTVEEVVVAAHKRAFSMRSNGLSMSMRWPRRRCRRARSTSRRARPARPAPRRRPRAARHSDGRRARTARRAPTAPRALVHARVRPGSSDSSDSSPAPRGRSWSRFFRRQVQVAPDIVDGGAVALGASLSRRLPAAVV